MSEQNKTAQMTECSTKPVVKATNLAMLYLLDASRQGKEITIPSLGVVIKPDANE
jgi:hypothetical protein